MLNTPRPANPYSSQPDPATLSPARRLSPVIPAPSYSRYRTRMVSRRRFSSREFGRTQRLAKSHSKSNYK